MAETMQPGALKPTEDKPDAKREDQKFLTESGNWNPVKDQPDTWTNKARFTCINEFGRTQSVPDGIIRPTAEAAKLERLRPKKK